jgi:hypothetical protein
VLRGKRDERAIALYAHPSSAGLLASKERVAATGLSVAREQTESDSQRIFEGGIQGRARGEEGERELGEQGARGRENQNATKG